MRRTAAVLVLLTATTARANVPRDEEIQLFCATCMGSVFAVVLLCILGMLVIERRNCHNGGPTGLKPPRALPPQSN